MHSTQARVGLRDPVRRNPSFAQVWYPKHDPGETHAYLEEACHDIIAADRD